MFILNQQKNFKTKIRDFWNNLLQKKDYILFKINNQKINLLCFNVKENEKIILAAETIFIENLINNITNQDIKESFYFLLKQFIKKNNINPKAFIGVIPEENYFYQIISAENENGAFNIIKNKINEDGIYDIQNIPLIDKLSKHQDYAVWIANKNYINTLNNIFQPTNIDVLGFEPENKNITYAIFDNLQTKDAYLIINILENVTNLIIFSGNTIHFSGFLQYGLNDLGKKFNNLLEEINKLIYFYMTKSTHEHGASFKINKILINKEVSYNFLSLISLLNNKIKVEKIKINNLQFKNEIVRDFIDKNQSEFLSLIGGVNNNDFMISK